jgi:dolichol-phosphate hexosyltransferase
MKLSIIIPAYNEAATIAEVIRRAQVAPLPCEREVIVVDDGSTDETDGRIWRAGPDCVLALQKNCGKGAAIIYGLQFATGDYICILDADLELAPEDIPSLLLHEPAVSGVRAGRSIANRLLSMLFGMNDVCCGLKVIRTDVLRSLDLQEPGFGFECELVAELKRRDIPIIEVPVSYFPRGRAQGKKIRWWDAFRMLRYAL